MYFHLIYILLYSNTRRFFLLKAHEGIKVNLPELHAVLFRSSKPLAVQYGQFMFQSWGAAGGNFPFYPPSPANPLVSLLVFFKNQPPLSLSLSLHHPLSLSKNPSSMAPGFASSLSSLYTTSSLLLLFHRPHFSSHFISIQTTFFLTSIHLPTSRTELGPRIYVSWCTELN